jgi:hypothetical protein
MDSEVCPQAHKSVSHIGSYAFDQIFESLKVAVQNNASKQMKSDLVKGLIITKGKNEFVA